MEGQTELYEKESDTPDVSGYGYELTFKLKKDKYEDEEAEIRNICGILQMIARLTFTKGEISVRSNSFIPVRRRELTQSKSQI